ncbi:possible pilus assembly protein PilW [Psychrobacter arcticus 273-4]|uniref:Possible pilus assembly protein PilW n=1 Tax=Psychrobacter arcticus (strain DSM 17307 / VKM B-2377 / 273-4) TaxID=259536 RepID=Q4FV52_PSYA2|nr:PilW family protein [Psychrobacter arcticus]AAZ18106.1 possible pilus assembly protein PilW [Psychrobacter arcticus 273-4]
MNPYNKVSAMAGFTLIELMISLVLGLLISAAVMQVYFINTRTLTVQQSASEVQDSTIFALQSLNDHIRIANLGNPISNITDTTDHGGVVLTPTNLGTTNGTATTLLTNSMGSTGWTGISNITNVASDQLTIQYKNITPNILYDCEGTVIPVNDTNWVIERYFVRAISTTVPDLALACDAGRATDAGAVTNFGDNGEVIIQAVDQFQVLLGAQADVNNLTYLPAKTYLELTDKPAITTVKVGVIVRSTTPLIAEADKETFTVLGTTQTLKTDSSRKKFYRRAYESTVLLRNARVMSVIAVATAP